MAVLCIGSLALLLAAFALPLFVGGIAPGTQLGLIAVAGFVMTCTVGPVSAVVIDVVHPGVRATGSSVLALFQNLFGLAAGPLVAGLLSDAFGLATALAVVPFFAIAAAAAFARAARTYEADAARAAASE
jgi:MFS transporter, Spinster family, sphingosine-1-phosphate transporter